MVSCKMRTQMAQGQGRKGKGWIHMKEKTGKSRRERMSEDTIVRHKRCDQTQRLQLSWSLLGLSSPDCKFCLELEHLNLSRANQS
jgi:hypothetical protein